MEKRGLVSRGFLFIVVILLYIFTSFVVVCVALTTPPYFRMKLDYPLFIFCCQWLVLEQNWFKVLLSFFSVGDWQESPLFMLRKTGFWFLFQQGTLTVLIFSTTLPHGTAPQVTRKESTTCGSRSCSVHSLLDEDIFRKLTLEAFDLVCVYVCLNVCLESTFFFFKCIFTLTMLVTLPAAESLES